VLGALLQRVTPGGAPHTHWRQQRQQCRRRGARVGVSKDCALVCRKPLKCPQWDCVVGKASCTVHTGDTLPAPSRNLAQIRFCVGRAPALCAQSHHCTTGP
jgi:hypothetical protein